MKSRTDRLKPSIKLQKQFTVCPDDRQSRVSRIYREFFATVFDETHTDSCRGCFFSLTWTKTAGFGTRCLLAMVTDWTLPHSSQIVFQSFVGPLHLELLRFPLTGQRPVMRIPKTTTVSGEDSGTCCDFALEVNTTSAKSQRSLFTRRLTSELTITARSRQ